MVRRRGIDASRFLRWGGVTAALLLALTAGAYYLALHTLEREVIKLLGERSEYGSLLVSLRHIVITDLQIHGDAEADAVDGWPTPDELRAARVEVEPDLRSLLSDNILIRKLRFEQAWLPIMRVDGRVRFLPALLESRRRARAAKGEPEGLPPKKYVHIAHVELVDTAIDYYDATVAKKPYLVPLRHIAGSVDKLKLPTLDEEALIDLEGQASANGNVGKVSLQGRLVPHTRDSRLKLQLRGVDLRLLQPYFIKATRAQIEAGTLDMDITSTVRDHTLQAPGSMVLHGLKLEGGLASGGLTRRLTLAILADKNDRIDLQFTLSGKLTDPKFSLNEELHTRVVAALATSLGVSIESLGKGALDVGEGIGSMLRSVVE
ncbi:DUF748 domain-containing protein [Uliginosibacterium sp. H3]|uniref:DUF748 domain-containing protein n=1 Tax=Uliginosibacterium silvisoli TaxID=3114758 RepID=A0ABU6JZY7_9RHOO|nr:DUF748 domain-containing protein [Uliginosibacterium sp. H3]